MKVENRINKLFQKKREILNIYFTAGFPSLESASAIIKELEKSDADMIEIGIPFSDPIADGPTIQQSNQCALDNGISLPLIFDQLTDFRRQTEMPAILMGYLNPIYQYGLEKFCAKCEEVGIDGLIIPDLPMELYLSTYQGLFEKHGLKNIFLITPQTSEARIKQIDQASDCFIYMVSSASTTGSKQSINSDQESYFQRIEEMNLSNPQLIGFGISNNTTFQRACTYAQGAIIGSAFIKMLSNTNDLEKGILDFVKSIREK